jgi:hypothetical protein
VHESGRSDSTRSLDAKTNPDPSTNGHVYLYHVGNYPPQNPIHYNKNKDDDKKKQMQTCQQFDETTNHIISACPVLAKNST